MAVIANVDAVLEPLVRSPRLKIYAERIVHILDEERIRREEFYDTVPEDAKVEFINGEVIFHMAVMLRHNVALGLLLNLINAYVAVHRLGLVGFEKLMISLTRNDYEPDICYFDAAKAATFSPIQTRFPAPDFMVEVLSESTEARDRGVKFDDYAAHGIREYWIVDPEAEVVEQYILDGDTYALRIKAADGSLRSVAIPGLEIPVRAVFDEVENLAALRRILG